MNENLTAIALVVDRSGSMAKIKEETIGGINSFVNQHKEDKDGDVKMTIAQFDNFYEVPYDYVDLKDVPEFGEKDFKPRGMTALLDAIGKTMVDLGKKFSDMDENERPGKVIMAIITDGEENSSKEFQRAQIAEMIKHQEEVYNWDVIFLGASLDAINVARSYGIAGGKALSYDTGKMDVAFDTMVKSTMRSKKGLSAEFTTAERASNADSTGNYAKE
jgi:uncharacterized protein YegL